MNPIAVSAKTAAAMLDLSLTTFKDRVAPHLTKIKLGKAARYDVIELNAWWAQTKAACGRSGDRLWLENHGRQDSRKWGKYGTCEKGSTELTYVEQLERQALPKRNAI
jgi:hypothetical protein